MESAWLAKADHTKEKFRSYLVVLVEIYLKELPERPRSRSPAGSEDSWPEVPEEDVCPFWALGQCDKGRRCRFLHLGPGAQRRRGKTSQRRGLLRLSRLKDCLHR